MNAKVDNCTELPLQEVQEVVWWTLTALGVDRPWVTVRVSRTDHWHHHGRFDVETSPLKAVLHAEVPAWPGTSYHRGLEGGPPPLSLRSWQEALVCIVAHEATHLRQFAQGDSFDEVESEWAEHHLLERWREEEIMSTQNPEYAIVIDKTYDAVLLRDLLRDAAQKHHTRASNTTQKAALHQNMEKYEVFAKYAERCEQIRLDEVQRVKDKMGGAA